MIFEGRPQKPRVQALRVVWSREEPRPVLPVDPERVDRSIPGSIAFVPSVAGLIAAGEVVRALIGRVEN